MPEHAEAFSTVAPAVVTRPSHEVAQNVRSDQRLCLHCEPPLTPAGFFAHRRHLLVGLGVLFVSMAIAGWLNGGSLLLEWDAPIQHWVEAHRTALGDEIFRRISFLGATATVLALGSVLAAVAWRRCRAVGVAVLLAMLSRPLLEFTLKALVSRDRPDFQRLVDGTGHSFPSGHVMAAVALWGLVPLVLTLYTRNRRIWWASVLGSGVLIVAIGASRVYLGVHWFSDVIGGLIVGTFFLLGTEWVLRKRHRHDPCVRGCSCAKTAEAVDQLTI